MAVPDVELFSVFFDKWKIIQRLAPKREERER
jgi:hypothetical protein